MTVCKRVFSALFSVFCVLAATLSPAAQAAEEPTAPPSLSAASTVLFEPSSGTVLYEKNAHEKRPMASTTKLMTALLAIEDLPLDRVVTATKQAVAVEGSSLGLAAGDTVTVEDLLTGLLLASGNDAANVVALTVCDSLPAFAARMNARAREIGMEHTVFVTPSGLDEGEHGACAYDMALLAAEVLQHPQLAAICAKKSAQITLGGRAITVKNHNRLLSLQSDCIGMKTGFTELAGRCLVSAARRDGVTLIAVTLHAPDDWDDHLALYEYGFTAVQAVTPLVPALPELAVAGGKADAVLLKTAAPAPLVLRRGQSADIQTEIILPPFAWAPLSADTAVGYVQYTLGGKVVGEMPVYPEVSVPARERLPYGTRVWNAFCDAWRWLWNRF